MSLAVKLQSDRPADAPLLLRADGLAWQSTSHNDHQELYAEAAKLAGIERLDNSIATHTHHSAAGLLCAVARWRRAPRRLRKPCVRARNPRAR